LILIDIPGLVYYNFAMSQALINCTEAAREKVSFRLSAYLEETGLKAYIQLSIKNKGCSGLAYHMEFCTSYEKKDYFIEELGLVVKADSLMWVMGTYMDYVDNEVSSGFVFTNPHQKRSCHCGEAFYI
jgi:iron-sulfur cluster assembly protein